MNFPFNIRTGKLGKVSFYANLKQKFSKNSYLGYYFYSLFHHSIYFNCFIAKNVYCSIALHAQTNRDHGVRFEPGVYIGVYLKENK